MLSRWKPNLTVYAFITVARFPWMGFRMMAVFSLIWGYVESLKALQIATDLSTWKLLPIASSLIYVFQPSLMDSYDYVMHGRIFSIKHIENQNIEVQASFGGLLCRLRGEQSQLESLQCDSMYVSVWKDKNDDDFDCATLSVSYPWSYNGYSLKYDVFFLFGDILHVT
jgi:hypothetical protein